MPLLLVPKQTSGNVGGRFYIGRAVNPVLLISLINLLVFAVIADNIHAIELHHVCVQADNLGIIRKAHFHCEGNLGDPDSTQAVGQSVTHCSPRFIIRLEEVGSVGKEIFCEIPNVFGTNIVHTATCFHEQGAKILFVENPLAKILDGVVSTNIAFPVSVDGSVSEQPATENLIVGFWLDRLPVIGVPSDGIRSHVVEDGLKCRGVHTSIDQGEVFSIK